MLCGRTYGLHVCHCDAVSARIRSDTSFIRIGSMFRRMPTEASKRIGQISGFHQETERAGADCGVARLSVPAFS